MRTTIDFGIDLGTSNSAIALQDGAAPRLLEASDGSVLLPSAIHIRADGSQVIGAAAIKARRDDPANTAIEFKRQMGTGETLSFPASGRSMSAIELSAAILREPGRKGRAPRESTAAGGRDYRAGHVPAGPVRGHAAGGQPGGHRTCPAPAGADRRGHGPCRGRSCPGRTLARLRPGRRHLRRIAGPGPGRPAAGARSRRRQSPGRQGLQPRSGPLGRRAGPPAGTPRRIPPLRSGATPTPSPASPPRPSASAYGCPRLSRRNLSSRDLAKSSSGEPVHLQLLGRSRAARVADHADDHPHHGAVQDAAGPQPHDNRPS